MEQKIIDLLIKACKALPLEDFDKDACYIDAAEFPDHAADFMTAMGFAREALKELDSKDDEMEGNHKDDDGQPCNCTEQECGYAGEDIMCPECQATEDDLSLVHGDHGYRCGKCNATFTCP